MNDKELKVRKTEAKSDIAVDNPTGKTATKPSVTGAKDKAKPNTKTASSKKVLNEKMVEDEAASNISAPKVK